MTNASTLPAARLTSRNLLTRLANDPGSLPVAEQLVSLVDPDSAAADQYRGLRYTVETLRKDSALHVIGVTSPNPGDGKTVTTLNLAGALAQAPDARVLVIDADLRKPSVAEYLGLGGSRPHGLTHALRDPACELGDVVQHFERFNLWVVPAGTPQASPYELLTSPRLDVLLRQARRDYDCVVIDTPPAVLLPDCRLIERWVDGFLIVVAAHKTPRAMVADAISQFDAAKVLGCVFNGDDRRVSSYYGYYRDYNNAGPRGSSRRAGLWQRLMDRR
jgi:capsular exopolysaccharide synthesis family protein